MQSTRVRDLLSPEDLQGFLFYENRKESGGEVNESIKR